VGGAAVALPGYGSVPFEPVCLKSRENLIAGSFAFARRIDILDAQKPLSAVPARLEVTRDRGEQ
jgi:hypothetical protein